jgi:hypothetical protein
MEASLLDLSGHQQRRRGSMPLTARLDPDQARAGLKLLGFKGRLPLPLRRRRRIDEVDANHR